MLENFIVVLGGIMIGTFSGLMPGIGTSISLIVSAPILLHLDITHLFLFFMSVLSTAQFIGTVPSIFLGIPGESNSIPAVIEGTKFRKKKLSSLAIGLCAIGSVFGSMIAVGMTVMLLPLLKDFLTVFLKDNFRIVLYVILLGASLFVFNRQRYFLNVCLLVIGFILSMIGPSTTNGTYRYTLGIEALQDGIPFYPLIISIMVAPIIFNSTNKNIVFLNTEEKMQSFWRVLILFLRNITASIRGAVIGFFSALVPGFGTLLSTTVSYTVESKINPSSPIKKILSAETANNSGGFAMLLPLVLIGIPLTASEFILYNYLIEAGWSPFQFQNLEKNAVTLMQSLVPWFVFVNLIALLIAWPLAKTLIRMLQKLKTHLNSLIAVVCIATTVYLGIDNYQLFYYIICLTVFSSIAIKFKEINLTPILFSFILGNDLEFVITRYITLWTH